MLPLVAAEQGASPTPASRGGELTVGLDDVIGAVVDQLRIDAEHEPEGALDLRCIVVRDAQLTHRALDQALDAGNVVAACGAYSESLGVGHATTIIPVLASRYRANWSCVSCTRTGASSLASSASSSVL